MQGALLFLLLAVVSVGARADVKGVEALFTPPPLPRSWSQCQLLLERARAPFRTSLTLRLVPSALRPDDMSPEAFFVGKVALSLRPDDDLEAVARQLEAGGSPATVRETLQRAVDAWRGRGRDWPLLLPLYHVAPRAVARLTNRFSLEDGPNCHNAVALWHRLGEVPCRLPPSRMAGILQRYFTPLAPGDERRFGDVITVWGSVGLNHTAIYLDDDLVWHKPGRYAIRPWIYQFVDDVIFQYAQDEMFPRIRYYRRNQRPPDPPVTNASAR